MSSDLHDFQSLVIPNLSSALMSSLKQRFPQQPRWTRRWFLTFWWCFVPFLWERLHFVVLQVLTCYCFVRWILHRFHFLHRLDCSFQMTACCHARTRRSLLWITSLSWGLLVEDKGKNWTFLWCNKQLHSKGALHFTFLIRTFSRHFWETSGPQRIKRNKISIQAQRISVHTVEWKQITFITNLGLKDKFFSTTWH